MPSHFQLEEYTIEKFEFATNSIEIPSEIKSVGYYTSNDYLGQYSRNVTATILMKTLLLAITLHWKHRFI